MRTAIHILVSTALAVTVTLTVRELQEPNCPTEDSCALVIQDGQWRITEVTP